jgi:hypothetical protein
VQKFFEKLFKLDDQREIVNIYVITPDNDQTEYIKPNTNHIKFVYSEEIKINNVIGEEWAREAGNMALHGKNL